MADLDISKPRSKNDPFQTVGLRDSSRSTNEIGPILSDAMRNHN